MFSCIQTATHICKALKVDHLEVDYLLCNELNETNYPKSTLPFGDEFKNNPLT